MHPTLRLPPIDTPRNPFVRLAFWLVKRRLGKVITPWRVLFARVPQAIPMQLALYWAMERLPLDRDLQLLVQMRTALANQCHFCIDIGRAIALQRGGTLEKLDAAADWRTDPRFTERERAALAYVEAASDPRGVPDETFAALRRHFDDREIAAITWINAVETYFNRLNTPLGIGSDGLCLLPAPPPAAAGTAA